jgi:hypothetical protein
MGSGLVFTHRPPAVILRASAEGLPVHAVTGAPLVATAVNHDPIPLKSDLDLESARPVR